MKYIIGGKYEITLKGRRAFRNQLAEGTIATLSKVFTGPFGGMWGNFKECTRYNYPLEYCRLVEAPSKLRQLITHVRNLDEQT